MAKRKKRSRGGGGGGGGGGGVKGSSKPKRKPSPEITKRIRKPPVSIYTPPVPRESRQAPTPLNIEQGPGTKLKEIPNDIVDKLVEFLEHPHAPEDAARAENAEDDSERTISEEGSSATETDTEKDEDEVEDSGNEEEEQQSESAHENDEPKDDKDSTEAESEHEENRSVKKGSTSKEPARRGAKSAAKEKTNPTKRGRGKTNRNTSKKRHKK